MTEWLNEEERKYLLLIKANGAIAYVPSQDLELARLLRLGLVRAEESPGDCAILKLSPYGHEVAQRLSL